jgi:membrane fusion protein (multidrug efflux system)
MMTLRVLALLLAGAWLSACSDSDGKPGTKAPPVVPVVVAVVEEDEFLSSLEAVGTTRANESVRLTASITETVDRVFFEDGQEVKAGALLVQLRDEQQQAELREAEVNLAQQRREYERLRGLIAQKAIAQSQLDEQSSRLDAAQAQLAAARARINERRINAPFSGVLGLRQVSPGALVEPGDLIATLEDLSTVKLEFSVPETFLGTLRPGQRVLARSVAFPERPFEGAVTGIDSRVDPVTRAVAVRAAIPNPELVLRPGMLMTVELIKDLRRSLAIPESALVPVGTQQFVFTVDAEDKVARVPVAIGRRRAGDVEILEGLTAGDRVVTEGTLRVRPGTQVRIVGGTDAGGGS